MRATRDVAGRHGRYFFLSYAHSPPLASDWPGAASGAADPDQWVGRFFRDLSRAVRKHASPQSELAPGFFDQEISVGLDWKTSLTSALGTAEVFVPLLSPRYYAWSWPGREWACFSERMIDARIDAPLTRFAPVLWIPLPSHQAREGLAEALELGGAASFYAEYGLRALLRLGAYREHYEQVLDRVAARIVELAERTPVKPSPVRNIDEFNSPFPVEEATAVFGVATAGPAAHADAGNRQNGHEAGIPHQVRPPGDQGLPLGEYADYAARVAEQLDFAVLRMGIEQKAGELLARNPGVVLIDPRYIADDKRRASFESFVAGLESWALPLLIVDPSPDDRTAELAAQVKAILTEAEGAAGTEPARRAINGVSSRKDFSALMPALVAEAERQYLRRGPVYRSAAPPVSQPRLAGYSPADQASGPLPSGEEQDV